MYKSDPYDPDFPLRGDICNFEIFLIELDSQLRSVRDLVQNQSPYRINLNYKFVGDCQKYEPCGFYFEMIVDDKNLLLMDCSYFSVKNKFYISDSIVSFDILYELYFQLNRSFQINDKKEISYLDLFSIKII